MSELSINGIYGRDEKIFSKQPGQKYETGITIDFSDSALRTNEDTPIYTLMGCGFNQVKTLRNPNQEFDDKGRLIEQNFGPRSVEYEYDENGIKTKEIHKSAPVFDPDGEETITIIFDKNGKAVSAERISGIGQTSKTFNATVKESVDSKTGQRIRVFDRGNGNTVRFFYDDENRIVRTVLDNSEVCFEYEYNEQGLMSKEKCSVGNSTVTYKYNANNQLVSIKDGDELIKYTYDSSGKLTRIDDFTGGEFFAGLRISYDENGRESERKYIFDDGKPYRIIRYKDGEIESDKSFP